MHLIAAGKIPPLRAMRTNWLTFRAFKTANTTSIPSRSYLIHTYPRTSAMILKTFHHVDFGFGGSRRTPPTDTNIVIFLLECCNIERKAVLQLCILLASKEWPWVAL